MQIRGCHKEMVCLRCTDSPLFEEALFLLRQESAPRNRTDLLAEAERILREAMPGNGHHRRRGRAAAWPLVLAFSLGAVTASLIWLFHIALF